MAHQIGLLLPWLVFAIAVGLKSWKVSHMINRQGHSSPLGMKLFRAALERNWQRSESQR